MSHIQLEESRTFRTTLLAAVLPVLPDTITFILLGASHIIGRSDILDRLRTSGRQTVWKAQFPSNLGWNEFTCR
jgi:hypothetical protein